MARRTIVFKPLEVMIGLLLIGTSCTALGLGEPETPVILFVEAITVADTARADRDLVVRLQGGRGACDSFTETHTERELRELTIELRGVRRGNTCTDQLVLFQTSVTVTPPFQDSLVIIARTGDPQLDFRRAVVQFR